MIDHIHISNNHLPIINKILCVPELKFIKEEQILKQDGSLFYKQIHTYKKLKFIFLGSKANGVFEPTKLDIKGSLHYYWNNGEHNYNNFTFNAFKEALNELEVKFYIIPIYWQIHSLEFGINIETQLIISDILSNSFYNGNCKFLEPINKPYKQAGNTRNNDLLYKLYDKGFQFRKLTNKNILRYEIRFNNSRSLNRKGIYNLSDLLVMENILLLHSLLIESFESILFSDFSINEYGLTKIESKNLGKYKNPINWDNYKNNKSRNTFRNNKIKFDKMINKHSKNVLKYLSNEFKKKGLNNIKLKACRSIH